MTAALSAEGRMAWVRVKHFAQALGLARTASGDECVEWQGYVNPDGYGRFSVRTSQGNVVNTLAHRAMFETLRGPIPDGLQLDHLCRNRACVNPAHLEPVDNRQNVRRGFGARFGYDADATCIAGHPRSPANLALYRGKVRCRPCRAESEARRITARRDEINARRRELRCSA